MRIEGRCANCGRDFLPEQVTGLGGRCPWCGKIFNRDYTALLVQNLQQAGAAGDALQEALERIASIGDLAMEIDEESVLGPLREALRAIRRRGARV